MSGANALVLSACIAEMDALRYTPAGLPAVNVRLEHSAELLEAGQPRLVKASVKAVALGVLAERLVQQAIGSTWRFQGFVASSRNGKGLLFHIQDFARD